MHHVDLIVGEYGVEEIRKGANQTRPHGVVKTWDLGSYPIDGEVGPWPGRRPPGLIEDGGQSQADLTQTLGGGRQQRRAWRRNMILPSSLRRRGHGDRKGGGEDSRLN